MRGRFESFSIIQLYVTFELPRLSPPWGASFLSIYLKMPASDFDVYWLRPLQILLQLVTLYISARALESIRLMKKDASTRNERAAKENALTFATRYAKYIESDRAFYEYCRAENPPLNHKLLVGDFSAESISLGKLPPQECELILKRLKGPWLHSVNELDCIAAAFVFGIADEKMGFELFGRSFCADVGNKYDLISIVRSKKVHDSYESIVRLYGLWSPRISKAELASERKILEERMKGLPDEFIPSIGGFSS